MYKNEEMKKLVVYLINFYKKYIPSKLEIHCKKGMYISFNFDWYSILLDHCLLRSVKNREVGVGVLLTDRVC